MFTPSLLAAASAEPDPMSHVLPHPLIGEWFTNYHLMALVVLVLGAALLAMVARRMPVSGQTAEDFVTRGRTTQLFEALFIFLRDEMTRPLLGHLTDKYIKYIWSTFFFILFANLLGLIPIAAFFDLIGLDALSHVGGALTARITFTAGLALIAMFMMIFVGLKENGLGFIKHMWPVPVTPPEGVRGAVLIIVMPILWAAGFVVFVIEAAGYAIKSFALCVRLFANIAAGHLVLGSLVVLAMSAPALGKGASVLGASVFSFLELFVAFLHAYVFTFLTVIFISLGAVHHDDHDEHDAGLDEGEMPGDALHEELTGTHGASAT